MPFPLQLCTQLCENVFFFFFPICANVTVGIILNLSKILLFLSCFLFFSFRIEALMNLCLSEDQVKNVCGDLIEQVLPLA